MPAKTSVAKVRKVIELRAGGLLIKQIARQIHLHRTTVGRILQEFDDEEIDLATHPAADLTAPEVQDLRLLCKNFCETPCADCGTRILYFRWSLGARCPGCKRVLDSQELGLLNDDSETK